MLLPRIQLRKDSDLISLVSSNTELQQRLRSAFSGDTRFDFRTVDGALSQFVSQLDASAGPSLLLADFNGSPLDAISSIENLRRHRFDGLIIAISDDLDEHAVRALLRLRVGDWLPAHAPSEDIVEACERALLVKRRPNRATALECISFVPAAGGVGNTTLAIQTAFLLAKRDRNFESTCLVDLDLQSGVLADYLDLIPGFKPSSVADAPERLDSQLLQVMLSRHASGMSVLASSRTPSRYLQVDPTVVTKTLSVASEMFDNLIIDLPTGWQAWTDHVLAGSDRIYVVTEFTVPALRKAHELVASLRSNLGKATAVKVVVNKCRHQFFSGGLSKRDATELLNDDLAGFVSEDHASVREAINRGRPLTGASSRINRELNRIVNSG